MLKSITFPAVPSPSIADQKINDDAQPGPSTATQIASQGHITQHKCAPCEDADAPKQTNTASTISAPLVQQTLLQRAIQDSQKNNYQAITRQYIQKWVDISKIGRIHITRDDFARQHLLNPLEFKKYVTANGTLKLRGRVFLTKEGDRPYREIEYKDIQAWQAMSQEERDHLTREGFAEKHQLSPQSFLNYVTAAGHLNSRGEILFNKHKGMRYQSVKQRHVQTWQDMSQVQREKVTLHSFAFQHSLNPLNFQNYITVNGQLKARGKALLNKQQAIQYQKINWTHIQAWQAMVSSAQHEQITLDEFAKRHQINPIFFKKYVKVNGQIKPRGQALANKQKGVLYQKIKWEDIQTWANMLPNERSLMTLGKFAEQRQISFNTLSLYVRESGAITQMAKRIFKEKIDGVAQQTAITHTKPTDHTLTTQTLITEDHAVDVKPFPSPGHPLEVQAITHHINNNAPILQHHLTGQTLTGEADHLHVSNTSWIALRPFLTMHSQSIQQKIKYSLIDQAKEWVRTEGHHQQRFDEMLAVAINIDETISRGTSVFAKKMIPAFTMIGPYSGTLLPDQDALEQLKKRHGHNNIQTYLYQAGPATGPYRDRTISAFKSGNVLSLINDAELSEPILDRNGQVLKNNIAAILIDNKIFLVSVSDILPEQELFLDYGEEYQAHFKKQLAVHQQAVSIKQEGL